MDYNRQGEGNQIRPTQPLVKRLTVSRISIQHLLDNIEFSIPSCLFPRYGFSCSLRFDGWWCCWWRWTIWDVFKAPSAMIPDPVNLGVRLERSHRHTQFVRKDLVHLFRGPK